MQALLSVLLIIGLSVLAVDLSKFLFGRWFNPLALYSAVWCVALCTYSSDLIRQFPIGFEAWAAIIIAWVSLFLGAATFRGKIAPVQPIEVNRLRRVIILFSLVGIVGLVSWAYVLIREFGSLMSAVLANAAAVYGMRITNEMNGIPYVTSFLYAGCALGGIYTAKRGKLTLIGIMPLVLVAGLSFLMMARFGLGLSAVLFLTAFAFTPKELPFNSKHKKLAMICAGLMVAGFLAQSSLRGIGELTPTDGVSPTMESIAEVLPAAPNIYSYFGVSPACFGRYLHAYDHPKSWFGMYTFAPVFRLLAHFDLSPPVPYYEEFYRTPAENNTMTYLKNLHSDFGWYGIVLGPYILGIAAIQIHQRIGSPLCLAAMPFLCALLVFSFFSLITSGDWYIGLGTSLLAMKWIIASR